MGDQNVRIIPAVFFPLSHDLLFMHGNISIISHHPANVIVMDKPPYSLMLGVNMPGPLCRILRVSHHYGCHIVTKELDRSLAI